MKEFELIIAIVNPGYSGVAMEAAREKGAGGGTILKGRGASNALAEQKYNRVIEEEKEVVYIIALKERVDAILDNIYEKVNMREAGNGIAYSMPVERVVGIPEKQFK